MDIFREISVVEFCLQMMTKLWEMRTWEVVGKEEVVKQHNRKAFVWINVWVLHKLQDQSRPSNVFFVISGSGQKKDKNNSS